MLHVISFPTTLSLLILVTQLLLTLTTAQPIVDTSVGKIQGYYDAEQNVTRFNNIPFALAPVGTRRFKSPVLYLIPLPTSPYPANSTAIIDCIQPHRNGGTGMEGQEDCLYLSVPAPNPLPAPDAGLPVVVYICGGGFQQCYGNDAGSWMRRTQSFIFVNINYRLGIFGNFALKELSAQQAPISYSGNQGLWDQHAALRWVQTNIAAFGGDPSKVTVQGESAGSISICYHIISPWSAGLFRAAIMESGGCEVFRPWGGYTLSQLESYCRDNVLYRSSTNCGNLTNPKDRVTCVSNLSVDELYELYRSSSPEPTSIAGDVGYWSMLDGVFLPDTPTAIFRSRRANNVSVLLGTNAGETVLWLLNNGPSYSYNYTQSLVDANIGYESGGNATVVDFYNAANYQRRYNGSMPGDINHIYVDATTAEAFHCPVRRVAKYMSAAQNTVFHYRWNYLQSTDPTAWSGWTAHSRELAVVFYYGLAGTEDAVMAAQIQNYLHRFIAFRDVNMADANIDSAYSAVYGNNTLPMWLNFNYPTDDHSLLIHNSTYSLAHFSTGVAVHADQCDDLWDANVLLPVVERRVTQCTANQCTVDRSPGKGDSTGNACVDNYNSTYYCVCATNWAVSNSSRLDCVFLGASSSSSSTGSHNSSLSSTEAYNTSSTAESYSSCLSWSSSSNGSTGPAADTGAGCEVWCYVAIALIVLLSLGFMYMIYRMYTNSRKRKAAATATSPRTTSGSAVPSISSGRTSEGGDEYSVSDERGGGEMTPSGGGRLVKKKKKVKKIRVDTGAGTSDALLADDRV